MKLAKPQTGKSVEDFVATIRTNLARIGRSQAARNQINVALSGIYHIYGRSKANEVIDEMNLGALGWARIDR